MLGNQMRDFGLGQGSLWRRADSGRVGPGRDGTGRATPSLERGNGFDKTGCT